MSSPDDKCYHCHLPVPETIDLVTVVFDAPQKMCCIGCQAVSQAIVDNGLDDYYRFRTEPAVKGETQDNDILAQLSLYDDATIQQEFVSQHANEKMIQLSVEGISCSACGWLIEKKMSQLKGITRVAVNVSAQRATLTWDDNSLSLSQLLNAIESIGYHARPFQPDQFEAQFKQTNKDYLKRLGLAGLMTMQVMMLAIGLYFSLFGYIEEQTRHYFHYMSLLLTIPVVSYSAIPFYQGAYRAIRNTSVNMDVPIVIATIGAFIASCYATFLKQGIVYFESICMFIFLLLVSRYLEHKSRAKAAEMSSNSIKHIPVTASVKNPDGSLSPRAAKLLQPGDIIVVKPGEAVPADATVITGFSEVDESMLTGEFAPVTKTSHMSVFGGTINHQGVISCRVEKPLKEALVNQIMRLQELAMASKPRIALYADQFSQYFVLFVLLTALLSSGYWYFTAPETALPVAIAVLVATCPCALGLATPVALTCGTAKLRKLGILIKQADSLETISQVTHLCFDKTGTLTNGEFSVISWKNITQREDKELLCIVSSMEALSEHPIATALSKLSQQRLSCTNVTIVPGGGITATIQQQTYYIGSQNYIGTTHNIDISKVPSSHTVILASQQQVLASFELQDTLRQDCSATIASMRDLVPTIISGDLAANVHHIATQLDIKDCISEASPTDKLKIVEDYQQKGRTVMMVGDGINDAPTLSAADVSVAIGGSTDLARSAADIIFLDDRLSLLPRLFEIAKDVDRTIKQNMVWAIGYNVCVLPLAVCGVLSPWIAVIGMSLSSIIVVSNSVRMLRREGK